MISRCTAAPFRGSRKHVLNLVGKPNYASEMNGLFKGTGVSICAGNFRVPVSEEEPEEATFRQFQAAVAKAEGRPAGDLGYRWVSDQYKSQTWDLISQCAIDGKPGILLVEAKAHETELSYAGKQSGASPQSKKNHAEIADLQGRPDLPGSLAALGDI